MKIAKVLTCRSRQDYINRMWGGTPALDFSFDWSRGASHVCVQGHASDGTPSIRTTDLGFVLQYSPVQRRSAVTRMAVNRTRKDPSLVLHGDPKWPL